MRSITPDMGQVIRGLAQCIDPDGDRQNPSLEALLRAHDIVMGSVGWAIKWLPNRGRLWALDSVAGGVVLAAGANWKGSHAAAVRALRFLSGHPGVPLLLQKHGTGGALSFGSSMVVMEWFLRTANALTHAIGGEPLPEEGAYPHRISICAGVEKWVHYNSYKKPVLLLSYHGSPVRIQGALRQLSNDYGGRFLLVEHWMKAGEAEERGCSDGKVFMRLISKGRNIGDVLCVPAKISRDVLLNLVEQRLRRAGVRRPMESG